MPRKRTLPSLVALRSFESAARHKSFRKAAEELGVTESAVSHQISSLESVLETKLFRRTPNGVQLNEAGAVYFPFLREAFDKIEHGTDLIQVSRSENRLTVQVYVTVAVRWLIPKLHEFRALHPEIRVALDSSLMDWDFNAKAADLGIVYSINPNKESVEYVPLFKSTLILVCSPALAKRVRKLADIRQHTALQVFTAPDDWSNWLAASGLHDVNFAATEKFDSYLLAIEAAIDGQGLMVVPDFMVEGDISANRLVEPLKARYPQPGQWYLAALRRKANKSGIQKFRRWLVQQTVQ